MVQQLARVAMTPKCVGLIPNLHPLVVCEKSAANEATQRVCRNCV